MSLEDQLRTLAQHGITLSSEATLDDLLSHHSREEFEAAPYKKLVPVLGFDLERDSFAPLCHRLWMCDYERIEDHGSYVEVITRLHSMSEEVLPLSGIRDYVDIEAETAWVEFDLEGSRLRWDVKVDNDWLDPSILVKFNELLKARCTPFRIYANHTEFGQSAFFACLSEDEFTALQ